MAVLPDLSGSRVKLRRPSDDDIDALMRLPIDPGIVRMYGIVHNGPWLRTQGDAERVVRWMRAEPYLWVIDVDDHYVGHVRLHTVIATDERASLAIGIDDASRLGQGLGT